MVDLGARAQGDVTRIAVVMDVRSRAFSADLGAVLKDLDARGYRPRLLFLEASDPVLVRRFEQVRRSHPLQGDDRLVDGIAAERALLGPLRDAADLIVDTSTVAVPALRLLLERAFGEHVPQATRVSIVSFGFKYGLPMDADLVVDLRFLPNPHWIPELRDHTGRDDDVRDYVLSQAGCAGVRRPLPGAAGAGERRIPARGQALPDPRRRLHRRQAPQRRDQRGARSPAGRGGRHGGARDPPRPGPRVNATTIRRRPPAPAQGRSRRAR